MVRAKLSAEPEAAITFMSMMYTSPEISNLMAWGIEGRDYIVEDGVAKYPDGNSEVPYHSDDFLIGNQFLALPWEGNSPTMREESLAQMEAAPISAYLGFTANTDSIATEVSALSMYMLSLARRLKPVWLLRKYMTSLWNGFTTTALRKLLMNTSVS